MIFSRRLEIITIEEVKRRNERTYRTVQIIKQNGKPAVAVIPYADYLALIGQDDDDATVPHEVAGLAINNGWNLVKAWRKHLGISQKELATRAGVSQPALSQMENSDNP